MTADTINRSKNNIGPKILTFGPKILLPLSMIEATNVIYIRRAVDCKKAKKGRETLLSFMWSIISCRGWGLDSLWLKI